MGQPIIWQSDNGATSTGAKNSMRYTLPRKTHAMQVVLGGGVADTAFVGRLEGSHDGATWFTLSAVDWSLVGGNVSGDQIVVTNQPVEYVRANIISRSGGTNPTDVITITSMDDE